MRPIASEQDILQFPLNELFGTPANVRLLRLLAEQVSGPVGVPEAAVQTGLTQAGARRALRRLERTGFVEQLGGGRGQRFVLRETDGPLALEISTLFRRERERYQQLVGQLRAVLRELPEIQVAWVEVAPTEAGQPLHLGVLSDPRALEYLEEQVRQRVADIERQHDLTIEIHAFAQADAPDVPWSDKLLLAGHVPGGSRQAGMGHEDRDKRAAAMSRAIASFLERDASLLRRAKSHVEFLLEQDQGAASHDLREWSDILSGYSQRRIRDFLIAETPRARRLRQSSPFFAVLTPGQRDEVLDELEKQA